MPTLRPIGHEDRLSLVDHLDELRTRLIICLVGFVAAFAVCAWQDDRVLDIVNAPLENSQRGEGKTNSNDPLERLAVANRANAEANRLSAAFFRQLIADEGLDAETRRAAAIAATAAERAARASPKAGEFRPVTLGVGEPFFTTITVAAYAAFLIALPLILYQLYAFVIPAFTPDERRVVSPLMMLVPFLFIGGVVFSYFIVLPSAVDFLTNFNDDEFDILVQARDYYRFSIYAMAAIGLCFQIPVGVLAVTRSGAVTTAQLRRSRRYVVLVVAILAAVATPSPDPVTMLLAMGPLLLLFELSILLASWIDRRSQDDTRGEPLD